MMVKSLDLWSQQTIYAELFLLSIIMMVVSSFVLIIIFNFTPTSGNDPI